MLVFPKIYGTADEKKAEEHDRDEPGRKAAEEAPAKQKPSKLNGPRRIRGELQKQGGEPGVGEIQVLVFFSSLTTTTEKIARDYTRDLHTTLEASPQASGSTFLKPRVLDLAEIDYDEYFISLPKQGNKGASQPDFFYLYTSCTYLAA